MDLVSLVEILLLVFMINQRNKIRSFTEKIKCPLFLLCFSMKYRDVSGKPIISLCQLSPLVKILLLVFIQWNKIRSYTEKIKYSLYIWIWYDHFIVVIFFFFLLRIEPPHDKTNKVSVRLAKTQISLDIRPVWSESSLSAGRKLRSLATHWAHSEDSDQTGRMPRLIRVFAGRTLTLLVLSCRGSNDVYSVHEWHE